MVEEQKQRIEREMTRIVDELDRDYLRKLQADMHRCAATCCENKTYSIEKVNVCVENCASKLNWAQSFLQKELGEIQNRIQRCVMNCRDDITLKLTSDHPSQAEGDMHRCSATCCDNKTSSLEEVNECLLNCAANLNKAQSLVQNEVDQFRNRTHRCVMACNDNIKAKINPESTQAEIDQFVEIFEACSKRCVDRHLYVMPLLINQLKSTLKKINK